METAMLFMKTKLKGLDRLLAVEPSQIIFLLQNSPSYSTFGARIYSLPYALNLKPIATAKQLFTSTTQSPETGLLTTENNAAQG